MDFPDGRDSQAHAMKLEWLLASVHVWLAIRAAGMENLCIF